MVTQLLLLDPGTTAFVKATARSAAVHRTLAPSRAVAPPAKGSRLVEDRPAGDPGEAWGRLDEHTRELGRRGIEDARRALAAAVERVDTAA